MAVGECAISAASSEHGVTEHPPQTTKNGCTKAADEGMTKLSAGTRHGRSRQAAVSAKVGEPNL
jgi:hypothetical protein